MSLTLGRLLRVGNVAEIFEWGSRVVKLYKATASEPAAFREAALHAAAESAGLPVPRVWSVQEFGGRWGLVFDRAEPLSFAERMLNGGPEVTQYLECMVRLQTRIHAEVATRLPDLKTRLATRIADAASFDERQRQDLLWGIADRPDGVSLCHGDFHPANILGDTAHPLIIDWADACRGDPAADVCRSYLLLKLHAAEVATAYLDGYCVATGISRRTVFDWLPYVAAARVVEAIPGEHDSLLRIVDAPGSE